MIESGRKKVNGVDLASNAETTWTISKLKMKTKWRESAEFPLQGSKFKWKQLIAGSGCFISKFHHEQKKKCEKELNWIDSIRINWNESIVDMQMSRRGAANFRPELTADGAHIDRRFQANYLKIGPGSNQNPIQSAGSNPIGTGSTQDRI